MSLPSSVLLLPNPKTFPLFPPSISFSPPNGPLFPSHNNSIKFLRILTALSASSSPSFQPSSSWLPLQDSDDSEVDDFFEDEHVIGDCVVFEEGAFEDPTLETSLNSQNIGESRPDTKTKPSRRKKVEEIEGENLVPEKWSDIVAEINITKKERRKIAQEMEFGSKIEKKKQGLVPLRDVDIGEYLTYREAKLAQLKPVILDKPSSFGEVDKPSSFRGVDKPSSFRGVEDKEVVEEPREGRVAPKNPRWAVYGKGLEDVNEFFKQYEPTEKNPEGRRKLFSKEEKILLNTRVPDLAMASSGKWLPLHTLAASGEFYLMNILLKYKVDINAVDQNGLSALHKAITCKKQAITEYLLRESANPFVLDEGGATLMHYAVQTASSQAIKILLLYNVDINQPDHDGWTPLHLAVQARRTDVVRLLLIKGADKTLQNQDGLTPLDLCLYSGRDTKTYELIKLLKQLPKQSKLLH